MDFYIFDQETHEIKLVDNHTWARWFEDDDNRRIKRTELPNGVMISTVFLGIEHLGGMFETMAFNNEGQEYQERCYTYKEALEMHERMCNLFISVIPENNEN